MICENCGVTHDGSYASGRFCSCKCARSFSTKSSRKEINEKVSRTLCARYGITKKHCKECGAKIKTSNKTGYCLKCIRSRFPSALKRNPATSAPIASAPYNDYYLYVVYHRGEGRRYANLVHIDGSDRKRITISYARYLMSVKLGRILTPDEEVDHIDGDRLNDSIENLQVLTKDAHRKKTLENIHHEVVDAMCPMCKSIFTRNKNKMKLSYGARLMFCSRSCSGRYYAKLRNGDKSICFEDDIRNNVIRIRSEQCVCE